LPALICGTVEDDLGDNLNVEGCPHPSSIARCRQHRYRVISVERQHIDNRFSRDGIGSRDDKTGRRCVPPAILVCVRDTAQTMA
jgi:hypothetical protein